MSRHEIKLTLNPVQEQYARIYRARGMDVPAGHSGHSVGALIPLPLRQVHRVWAEANGYFWLPCPLCRREFGRPRDHRLHPRSGRWTWSVYRDLPVLHHRAQFGRPHMTDLAPIPLDDAGLSAIEHALDAVYTIDDGGEHQIQGAEYSLSQLLDFWSGFDHTKGVQDGYIGDIPVYYFDSPTLTERCLIRALVAEVRRLREHETTEASE